MITRTFTVMFMLRIRSTSVLFAGKDAMRFQIKIVPCRNRNFTLRIVPRESVCCLIFHVVIFFNTRLGNSLLIPATIQISIIYWIHLPSVAYHRLFKILINTTILITMTACHFRDRSACRLLN